MAISNIPHGARLPYDGLFGDSNLIRVIRQVIADPFTSYRPIDLEILTKNRAPTVRESLKVLTSAGLLLKDESDHQHPIYRVNTKSKRYLALTFLAYAVLDDRNGTDCMDDIVVDYCGSILKEKYVPSEVDETYKLRQPLTEIGTEFYSSLESIRSLFETSIQDGHGAPYTAPILTDTVKPDLAELSMAVA
jgi:hypothetical protein